MSKISPPIVDSLMQEYGHCKTSLGVENLSQEHVEAVLELLHRCGFLVIRWIPVWDKLPDKDGSYAVIYRKRTNCHLSVKMANYHARGNHWEADGEVRAWLPKFDPLVSLY